MNTPIHIATYEIQTSEIPEGSEKVVAEYIYLSFESLARKHGFGEDFTINATWKRGCVIEQISIWASDSDAILTGLTAAGTYIALKDYKSLRESTLLLLDDVRNIVVKTKELSFNVVRAVVSERKKPPLKERIEPTLGFKENDSE